MKSKAEREGSGPDSVKETELLKARVKAQLLGEPDGGPRLGRFLLLRALGQGATGAVYAARDEVSGAEVALKLLRAQSASAVHSFKQEFRGLTHVVHENLVQLHELFADGQEWYFTMELVRGVKFNDYAWRRQDGQHEIEPRDEIEPRGSCDHERLRGALAQLLSGVRAIHSAGKLHCDLKPSNVLVTAEGRVVVLDFGLLSRGASGERRIQARGAQPAPSPDGTPPYMAPELDAGHAQSTASDAYALGVMLFQALTGRLPFEGKGPRLTRARSDRAAPRARELAAETPAELDALAAGLLAIDPAERLTIEQALDALNVRAAPARASSPPPARTALIGRERELSELHAAFDAVGAERPVMMRVRGRSGIGKSALADRFATELRARDVVVLRGRCHERESLPYKAFDGVVDALVAHARQLPRGALAALDRRETGALLRVFPHLRRARELLGDGAQVLPASQQELRRLAFAGLKALLHALCRERAVALIVDDLQWADLDSARLLLELLGPPDAPGLLYVGCYREDEVERSEFLRELTGAQAEGDAQREIALCPLPAAAATALALEVLRGAVEQPELACERIARESEGVPLLVRELCAHFVKDDARAASGPALGELLAARVSALDGAELCALSLLSLAARPISERVLAHALREEPSVQRALRALRVHGLVHADAQGSFVVYHDRLREHVSERVPHADELTSAALHRRLAEAYEATHSGEPEWLIEHWQAAGDDASAYRYALTAAELAVGKLAFHRAAGLYAAALALAPAGDPRRVELAAARGEALVNAGRGAEAARAFSSAAAAALQHAGENAREVALELRCRATQQLLRSGHLPEASRLLRELFVEVGLRYPESSLEVGAQLIASRARLALRLRQQRKQPAHAHARPADDPQLKRQMLVLGAVFREHIVSDPLRAPLFHAWYYEAALRAGDAQGMFNALIWDTYFYVALRGASAPRQSSERLERIHRLAAELDTPHARASAELIHGTADLYASRYPEALAREQSALTIFREQCLGTAWEESVCALTMYAALENVGPMTVMRRDARAFVRRARERDDQLTDALISIHMGCALLAEDRADEANDFLAERLARLSGRLDMQRMGVNLRMIDVQVYRADGESAWAIVDGMWRRYLLSGFDLMQFWRAFTRMRRAHAAILLHQLRPQRQLLRIAAADAGRLERMRRADADILAAGIRGALAVQRGALEDARGHMRRAVAEAERQGVPITAHAYRRQLGRIVPGQAGADLIALADDGLRAQGVFNPERWAAMYAPGF